MSKTTDFSRVDKLVNTAMKNGLTSLGNDIKKRAVVLAPKDTGTLRQSARIDVNTGTSVDNVTISFNTPYARRRHFENFIHPSTKLYLYNAAKSITNPSKYFKETF